MSCEKHQDIEVYGEYGQRGCLDCVDSAKLDDSKNTGNEATCLCTDPIFWNEPCPRHPNTGAVMGLDEIFAPLIDSPSLTLTTTYWNDAKDQIYSLLMDVIGADEADDGTIANLDKFGRNELRQIQRTKLNKLFNKEETIK